jgi:hypothetical protein
MRWPVSQSAPTARCAIFFRPRLQQCCDPCSANASEWWAVLGSNQWPMPCETGVRGSRIKDMRAASPVATNTWYHGMSFDITHGHARTVPKLSQQPLTRQDAPAQRATRCISHLNLVANCEDQNYVFGGKQTVFRDISVAASREDEFPPAFTDQASETALRCALM